MANDIGNGFGQYRRLILKELERLNEACENLRSALEGVRRDDLPAMRQEFKDEIQEMKTEIVADNSAVRVAKITGAWQFWAMLASSVTAIIVAVIALLSK